MQTGKNFVSQNCGVHKVKMNKSLCSCYYVLIIAFLLNDGVIIMAEDSPEDDEVTLTSEGTDSTIQLINTRVRAVRPKILNIALVGGGKFASILNNSTVKNIWTYPLVGNDGEVVRIAKTRTRPADRATEYSFVWNSSGQTEKVCFPFNSKSPYWYSSSVLGTFSTWPLNSNKFDSTKFDSDHPMTVTRSEPLEEHLYLSTDGFALHFEPSHPWVVKIEQDKELRSFCFSIKQPELSAQPNQPIDHSDQYLGLKFRILVAADIKVAYQSAMRDFGYISRPRSLPGVGSMFVNPILPVSSFLKQNQQIEPQSAVFQLISEFTDRNLHNWTLLLDEDTRWQVPGFVFNNSTFPNIEKITKLIQESGHQLSVQIEPSLSSATCPVGSPTIDKGGCIPDLTVPESFEWFMEKVRNRLTTPYRINSVEFFVYDIKEFIGIFTEHYPHDEIVQKYPSSLITGYAQLSSHFGAYRASLDYGFASQAYASFVRMKINSNSDSAVKQLITKSLIWSLGGYQFFQPQLVTIGKVLTSTLYLRWIQAVTFMPVMHIPNVPWQFSEDEPKMVEHVRACIELRRSILEPKLFDLIQGWVQKGEPIIRPMWLSDPSNIQFYTIDDQFMVGEDLLVAPITDTKGTTSRDVHFPPGNWSIGHNTGGKVFSGIHTFSSLKVEDFLYFVRIKK